MNTKEWFSSWFDTDYYHTLYKNRDDDEAKRFINNLLNFLELEPNSNLLDLACGKGRHSVTLNEAGFNVTGADLSANSINEAKSHENEKLSFIVHDMRKPIEGAKFNTVFNLFTSFGYFDTVDENTQVLECIYSMLMDQGLLIIDFMNASKVINTLVKQEQKVIDGIQFDIKRTFDGKHIYKYIDVVEEENELHFMERVQAIRLSDFETLLHASNFEILHTFGDFDLNPFNEEDSNRLILIAKKK